jgi:hypothetical protein
MGMIIVPPPTELPDDRDLIDEPTEPPPPAYPYVFVPFDDTDWGARPLICDWASPLISAVGNRLQVPLRNAGRGAALATYVFAYGLTGDDRETAVLIATTAGPVVPACGDATVLIDLPDPLPTPADCIQVALYDPTGAPPVPPLDARADRRVGQYRYPLAGRWYGMIPPSELTLLGSPAPGPLVPGLSRQLELAITAPGECTAQTLTLGGAVDGRRLFRDRLGVDAQISGRSLDAEYDGHIRIGPTTVDYRQHWHLTLTPDGRLDAHVVQVPRPAERRLPQRIEADFTLTRRHPGGGPPP